MDGNTTQSSEEGTIDAVINAECLLELYWTIMTYEDRQSPLLDRRVFLKGKYDYFVSLVNKLLRDHGYYGIITAVRIAERCEKYWSDKVTEVLKIKILQRRGTADYENKYRDCINEMMPVNFRKRSMFQDIVKSWSELKIGDVLRVNVSLKEEMM